MSPSFVFSELEQVLITEFGDLICQVSRSRQRVLREGIVSFARLRLLSCDVDESSWRAAGVRPAGNRGSRLESAEQIPRVARHGARGPSAKCALGERDADARRIVPLRLEMAWNAMRFSAGNWGTAFATGQKRPLEPRPASHSRILSSIITIHASTLFN